MRLLAVFADDFTGALDSGVQFTKAGFSTDVLLWTDYEALTENQTAALSEVIVIDTESRHLESAEAFNRLLGLTRLARNQEIDFFYKKTDSTLRGQIGAEMRAMMLGLEYKQIHFVPAYPKMNRLTIKGIQYVDGKRLAQTSFADDPLNPVITSCVPELLAAQGLDQIELLTIDNNHPLVLSPVSHHSLAVSKTEPGDSESLRTYLYNASSQDDLEAISHYLKNNLRLRLTAGCAGFAEPLAKRLHEVVFQKKRQPGQDKFISRRNSKNNKEKKLDHSDQNMNRPLIEFTPGRHAPVLLLCGSANQSSLHQLKVFGRENPKLKFHVMSHKEKHPEYWSTSTGRQQISQMKYELSQQGIYVIQSVRKREDLDKSIRAEDAAASFGTIAAALTTLVPDLNLIVFGGDTVYALMSVMHGSSLHPLDEISPGVVASCFRYGSTNRFMVTKAGGLGDDNVIKNILSYLKQQAK